jgi:GDP-L-fucose synthase
MGRMHSALVDGCGEMEVWGDGTPRREILFSDDLAEAMLHVMANETSHPVMNIGYGSDFTIAEIVEMLAQVTGFHGRIVFNTSKPNGSRGKLLDSSRIRRLGWTPLVAPLDGLRSAYQSYVERLPRPVS